MITKKILIPPGDGIGPEVTQQAVKILENVAPLFDIPA
jgi:Isocitrate/isopropylmalate dehydrogenase